MYEAGMANGARYALAKGGLVLDATLSACARRHSEAMARYGSPYHSSDTSIRGCKQGGSTVGENVGSGGTLGSIFQAMLRSRSHRDNILCRCFRRLGVGLSRRGGLWYITQEFWG